MVTDEIIEQLVSQYLKLEQSANELTEGMKNDNELQEDIAHIANVIDALQEERRLLTVKADAQAKEIGEEQKAILDELKTKYDGAKELSTNAGIVQYRITKKTIILDVGEVAGVLLKNNKPEAIKTFDMKIVRSFIEVGLLDDLAGFEENVNVKVLPLVEG